MANSGFKGLMRSRQGSIRLYVSGSQLRSGRFGHISGLGFRLDILPRPSCHLFSTSYSCLVGLVGIERTNSASTISNSAPSNTSPTPYIVPSTLAFNRICVFQVYRSTISASHAGFYKKSVNPTPEILNRKR